MTLIETLEKLSKASGVTGREEEVADLMKKLLKPYVDEIKEDSLGNVIGIKKGKKNSPKIMLAAHMDEIGLVIKTITKEGFLYFAKVGGIDDRILLAQKVLVYTEKGPLHGIIGSRPPHIQKEEERKKVISYDELFIDIGAANQEEAKKMGVKIGDPVGFDVEFARIKKDIVIGKALDDRVGCAIMIEALKRLEKTECTIYAVGTVQEEVGLRGAMTSAFSISPDVGLAIDVTVAGDTPGVKENEAPIAIKKGPSITIADSGMIVPPKILRLLTDVAEENKIPYQLETGLAGSTDAARILLTKEGIPSGVISVPTRYIHSPTSLLSLEDVENAVKLLVATIQKIPKYF
ncbi:M42 family metallopeptidase [Candidatus Bathyarchaeota archaeon]|nr:M42 family metallopeptidase [Candidatus Bathyarchaeota archaeon]